MILLRRIRVRIRRRVLSVSVTEIIDHARRIALWQGI